MIIAAMAAAVHAAYGNVNLGVFVPALVIFVHESQIEAVATSLIAVVQDGS